MDKSFNFSDLLRMQTHENKHKLKPVQFISIAGGVRKRLDTNVKNKRRTRLTNFDNFRNLPKCETPVQAPFSKVEQRMMQLQKWKVEKEKKKTEANAQKKKPFVVGVAKSTLKYEPPPSFSWPRPSSSGRVTRSQSTRNKEKVVLNNEKVIKKSFKFAPKNAAFNPVLKDLPMPTLSVFGEEKTGLCSDLDIESPNNAPKPELRSLRSRTKLSVLHNTNIKQNESSASSTIDFNTRKKPATKIKPTKKPLSDTNKLKQTNSSSSGLDSHEEEVQMSKVKTNISTTKTNKTRKGRKSVNSTRTQNRTKNRSTESEVENPPNTPISLKVLTRKKASLNASVTNENLVNLSSSMETDGEKPKNTRRSVKNTNVTPNKSNTTVPDFITFTPKNPVPKSESSSEEKLRSPKSIDVPMTPQQITEEAKKISPRVYLSRGKENTRKELKKRIDEGLLDDDACDMSVDHFRKQLDSEIKRMSEMCETWDKILEQTLLPDEIQEAVLAAVGQARLLMSQKMQQFASLVRRCERPEPGQALVTRGDLQGFWDMVFMQVEDVDMRFKKLEQSRGRGWAEELPASAAPPHRNRPPRHKPPARASRLAASKHLKDVIAAARRAKKAQEANTKTFEAGFFCVQSPVKSPAAPPSAPHTPAGKPSLLKSVLSSEAKKASAKKSSIAMLRASSIGKHVDSEPSSPYEAPLVRLTTINFGATPGKSILKSNNNTASKASSKISFKLFIDSDVIGTDSTQTGDEREIPAVQNSPNLDTSNISPNSEKLQHLKISSSSPNNEDGSVNMDVEKVEEGKENRRTSRRKLKLESQDAVEETTPVMTRSRRKTIQTPASENVDLIRSSRRKKTLLEVNEVKLAVTPCTTRSRRRV